MAGTTAACLAKCLEVIHRYRQPLFTLIRGARSFYSCQMEEAVEQCGSVASGKYETVAIGPLRVIRIVAQKALPEAKDCRGCTHRGTGMTGMSFFHLVDG